MKMTKIIRFLLACMMLGSVDVASAMNYDAIVSGSGNSAPQRYVYTDLADGSTRVYDTFTGDYNIINMPTIIAAQQVQQPPQQEEKKYSEDYKKKSSESDVPGSSFPAPSQRGRGGRGAGGR